MYKIIMYNLLVLFFLTSCKKEMLTSDNNDRTKYNIQSTLKS